MITHRLPLHRDDPAVYLDAYLLHNSPDFQPNQRRPVVIVCPGGGYLFTSDREAEPIAMPFLAQGYHALVVRYSVQMRFPQPMLDLAVAIATVRDHADEWLVDPDRIAVCGFSAGGHLAASLGVFWDKPFLWESLGVDAQKIRPNALILSYPVIDPSMLAPALRTIPSEAEPLPLNELLLLKTLGSRNPPEPEIDAYRLHLHVSPATPPTFLWHTADDELVPAQNSLLFASALAHHQVPYELHIFSQGVHGLALANEVTESQDRFLNPDVQIWVDLALKWLKRQRNA